MEEIRTNAELTKRVRGGMSAAEMAKNKMTYEEPIHKMLERILKNQIVILWHISENGPPAQKWTNDHINDTDALLEQVKK